MDLESLVIPGSNLRLIQSRAYAWILWPFIVEDPATPLSSPSLPSHPLVLYFPFLPSFSPHFSSELDGNEGWQAVTGSIDSCNKPNMAHHYKCVWWWPNLALLQQRGQWTAIRSHTNNILLFDEGSCTMEHYSILFFNTRGIVWLTPFDIIWIMNKNISMMDGMPCFRCSRN